MKMLRFLDSCRAPFLTAAVVPVVLGAGIARHLGVAIDPVRFVLALVGLAAAHAAVNLLNDYYDFVLGVDQHNPHRTVFNGGSPHLVSGGVGKEVYRALAIGCLVVAATCGMALVVLVDGGPGPVLGFMVVGFLGGFFYSAPPLKLAHRGLGEVAILACFGPLPVLATTYVLTGVLDWLPVLVSLPVAFLITNVVWINQFPDCGSDLEAGKRHLVARLGPERARWGYHLLVVLAYGTVAGLALATGIGSWALLALAGLPLSLLAARGVHRAYARPAELFPAQGMTVAAHLLVGIGLSVAAFL